MMVRGRVVPLITKWVIHSCPRVSCAGALLYSCLVDVAQRQGITASDQVVHWERLLSPLRMHWDELCDSEWMTWHAIELINCN